MNTSHFFAYMARMRLIRRWSLMRNTMEENDAEHTMIVAMIAHGLAVMRNERYGGNIDANKVATMALYHEAPEVITGDLPTPIKYFNPAIRDSFKEIEALATEQLMSYLPDDMRAAYEPLLKPDETSEEWKLVKAADRLSAYIKCLEESGYRNDEFRQAQVNTLLAIHEMKVPEAEDFLREFAPSFALPLDALN
ncbi:MAG: 5'-deoxynucleotidase [Clostridia bacterium]|nr:5'-deoxynucleotidase [Clostridia bacterium]